MVGGGYAPVDVSGGLVHSVRVRRLATRAHVQRPAPAAREHAPTHPTLNAVNRHQNSGSSGRQQGWTHGGVGVGVVMGVL